MKPLSNPGDRLYSGHANRIPLFAAGVVTEAVVLMRLLLAVRVEG
jgi:tetrahydromethanopterin S-methyltransferase subunit F